MHTNGTRRAPAWSNCPIRSLFGYDYPAPALVTIIRRLTSPLLSPSLAEPPSPSPTSIKGSRHDALVPIPKMPSIAHPNPFSAIDPDAGRVVQPVGAADQGTVAALANVEEDSDDIYVPETQYPQPAPAEPVAVAPATVEPAAEEPVTTREELADTSTTDDAADDAPASPVTGQVRPFVLTPSSKDAQAKTHKNRSASLGSDNAARWAAQGGPMATVPHTARVMARFPASHVPPIQVSHTDYGTGVEPKLKFRSALEYMHDTDELPRTGLNMQAAPTSLPSRPLGAPRTSIGLGKARAAEHLQAVAEEGEAIVAAKKFIKTEPLEQYLRRDPQRFSQHARGREESPIRIPSSSSSHAGDYTARPAYPFAQPQPQFTRSPSVAPEAPRGFGGFGGFFPGFGGQRDDDHMSMTDDGDPADDARDRPVPRPSGIPVHQVPMTEKLLHTARLVADELGYSSVPVNACGAPTPVDGMPKNAATIGIPVETIAYFENKDGDNIIIELWSINGRRAYHFSIDDQIDYLQHVLDRMFLEQFPDHRIEISHLFSPDPPASRNAPRARQCLFMGHGLHERQSVILQSARFWTAAGANFSTHGTREARSSYMTSFGGVRCDDLDEMTDVAKAAVKASSALRAFFTTRFDDEDPERVTQALTHIAENCIHLRSRQVRPSGQSSNITQWSVYAELANVLLADDISAFTAAMKKVSFSHIQHGQSAHLAWSCRMCHPVSHDAVACEAHLLLKWPLLLEGPHGGRGPVQNNAARRGTFPAPR
ncbi:hypothetical protein AURDEDRAFT_173280 [Auricularia subglabra TFB-10046 SS5]|uniref:Uncharacterized protein n=1 Tax=Auricularia subglabra (strain TFB-10046 / SS5) TaxID=717982 RepID=J0D039_AURST|nr:hypothetical protein AURDEDRAFT_173280 [Auricularia subglabra TFB-10046 SS5]